jgi:hypothetical protein
MTTSESRPRVEGAWRTTSYIVKGQATDVNGVLLLVDGRWSTLYFVGGREGPWGSAEAGSYKVEEHTLSFRHRLMFQGGGGRPLHVTQEAGHVEDCPIRIEEDTTTIQFPSGNTLVCQRLQPV